MYQHTRRVRAFSHKSRTGCLTCKKRRKKCDEEKPVCRRCKEAGFVCDGYKLQTIPATPQHITLPLLAAKHTGIPDHPKPSLSFGDALESKYYVYFFTDIISDLEISQSLNRNFWQEFFLIPSQNALSIRHTIVALGAAHWQFSVYNHQSSQSSFNGFILRHYNEAISSLVSSGGSTQGSAIDLSTVLTCCILFVLLESLRGDSGEALRHLESGLKILMNHKPKTYLPNGDVHALAAVFHAISSQVGLFAEDRIFPDVTHLLTPAQKHKMPTHEFRDLDEAENIMNGFDDVVNYITWDLDQDWEDETSDCNTKWQVLRQDVRKWEGKFRVLLNKLTHNGQYRGNLGRIVNLEIQHKLWELLLDGECLVASTGDEHEANLNPVECSHLLDQLDQLWHNPRLPCFGLKTDFTTALYQLYVYCIDESMRRRIISMLRSQRRREIVWDSIKLADFLETDMTYRVAGLQQKRWPDIGPSTRDGALLLFGLSDSLDA